LPHKKEVNGVAFHVTNQSATNEVEDVVNDYVIMNATDTRKTQSCMHAKSIGDGSKVSTNSLKHAGTILKGTFEHIVTIKEVSSTIMGAKCIPCIDKSSNTRQYKKKANM
jgi:hypothetical protein